MKSFKNQTEKQYIRKTLIYTFLKTCCVFTLGILMYNCESDDSPTNDDPTPPSQITAYSEIKNANWRDNIGKEFEVEGILIEENGVAKLLIDKDDYYIDAMTPEENYIYIDRISELDNSINFSEHFGKKVKVKGICQENDNSTIRNTAELFGNRSLATIVIQTIPNFKIITTNILIPRPSIINICVLYPQLCEFDFSQENKTALLYSGGINAASAHLRYWNDLKLMYSILRSKGYPENKIRVVYKNGIGEDDEIPVHYAANPTGLNEAFSYIDEYMNSTTKFFLMMNNHGGGKDNFGRRSTGVNDNNGDDNRGSISDNTDEQYFYYNSSTPLTDDYLATKINELSMGSMIAVVKPCYSGGVIWDFKGPNRVIMTSGTEFQVTWSHRSGQYGEFTYHFFAAITGIDPISGATVNADLNGNGSISMYEAQMYILANDTASEQPQYEDNNDGIGTSSPNATGFGASTYL
ncbi:C13 family peptidase [Bizionia myxarmorum]|uniref:Uncharacterized protein n=1 Tax=Bizionia myxarmorum TaxID=291186 RepID=A0A5D0REN2_9FLAO|nr:C13 family peptidase [Bizionia myxarmorum]TYB79391.1 hypothetical protein ES674_06355 [Bizionia myxarmorum]